MSALEVSPTNVPCVKCGRGPTRACWYPSGWHGNKPKDGKVICEKCGTIFDPKTGKLFRVESKSKGGRE